MSNEKHSIALSRALFELRSGRAIEINRLAFQAVESEKLPVGATLVAPKALDERYLPSNARPPANEAENLAIELLKRAGLLPAFAVMEMAEMRFDAELLQSAMQVESMVLRKVAEARVPLRHAENAKVISFRSSVSAAEHLAVMIGEPDKQKAPLVRVHSSCITGDLLGSLRCDCGDQLHMALKQISEVGHGIVCYLQQEGRGIGISNKMRAYELQDEGQDTLDANLSLGFAADERDFGLAASMLKALEIEEINLLSNNPQKVEQLTRYGIKVVKQTPLMAQANNHNADYLATKADRFGHKL